MTSLEDKSPTISSQCSYSHSSNSLPTKEIFDSTKLYQLLDTLGRSQDSTTYKALNLVNDQLVTVQIFDKKSPSCITSGQIDMLRRLNHPQLLKLLDILVTQQQVWLIFEYCQLGSLNHLASQVDHQFTEAEIAWICFNILNALEYLQGFSGYEGTLTLSNILINGSGQIKMTGFSLANDEYILTNLDHSFDGTSSAEYLHQLSDCIRKILDINLFEVSKELEDFLRICSDKSEEEIIELSDLIDHDFFQLYKPEFFSIRNRFSAQTLQELEDYRQKLNNQDQPETPAFLPPIQDQSSEDEDDDDSLEISENSPLEPPMSQPSFSLTERLETLGQLGQLETLESMDKDPVMYGDWKESSSASNVMLRELFKINLDFQKEGVDYEELDIIEEAPDTSRAKIETNSLIPSLNRLDRRSYWEDCDSHDIIPENTPIKPIQILNPITSEARKINESNFVVKHRSHHRASASTNVTDSVRSEIIETPFSKDSRRVCSSTMQIGDENKIRNIPVIHVKEHSLHGVPIVNESLVCRVLTYTPRESECKSGRQGNENGLSSLGKKENEQVKVKRSKLEVQMSKELQEIHNKYKTKFAELLREEEQES